MARILVADNRDSMRVAIGTAIKTHPGWEVCGEAKDGREAIAKAAELNPDLIVLDFKMPVENGIKAVSEIFDSVPTVPIVMYTLYKTAELEVAARLIGIRHVVGKEEGAKELVAAIEAELQGKRD
jgi:DNA-binding NarL/FixJ family response regulator